MPKVAWKCDIGAEPPGSAPLWKTLRDFSFPRRGGRGACTSTVLGIRSEGLQA